MNNLLKRVVGQLLIFASTALLGFGSTSHAAQSWPDRLTDWPLWWIDAFEASQSSSNVSLGIYRHAVRAGGVIASKGPALLFSAPSQLQLFYDKHTLDPGVHVLPPRHLVKALQNIDSYEVGGLVYDEKYGEGYILWKNYYRDNSAIWSSVAPTTFEPNFTTTKNRSLAVKRRRTRCGSVIIVTGGEFNYIYPRKLIDSRCQIVIGHAKRP